MPEPMLGEIAKVGFNFAPRGWAMCDGQLLPIAQNQALFSILGTTFGGDGRTSFGLPDLRSRFAVHKHDGTLGRRSIRLGEKGNESKESSDDDDHTAGPLGIYYVIALQGVFPSRK